MLHFQLIKNVASCIAPHFQLFREGGGGGNQKWPKSGPGGYLTLAVQGVPNDSERGTKSTLAHKWTSLLHSPCHAGGSVKGAITGLEIRVSCIVMTKMVLQRAKCWGCSMQVKGLV